MREGQRPSFGIKAIESARERGKRCGSAVTAVMAMEEKETRRPRIAGQVLIDSLSTIKWGVKPWR